MSDGLQNIEVELSTNPIYSSTAKELMNPTLITSIHLKRYNFINKFNQTIMEYIFIGNAKVIWAIFMRQI